MNYPGVKISGVRIFYPRALALALALAPSPPPFYLLSPPLIKDRDKVS